MMKRHFASIFDYLRKDYFIVAIFFIFLIPRIINLGNDISNYDASFWYPRMDNFSKALIRGNLNDTYQQYHPGITLMLFSGSSKFLFEKLFETRHGFSPRFYSEQFIKLQIATLAPIIAITCVFGIYWYKLLSVIINKRFAFIFCLIISIEPFFLGVSKFVHVTALASIFAFTSFLTVYYYVHINKRELYFYISALLLALALLTKIDSVIIGALIVFYLWAILGFSKVESFYKVISFSLIVILVFYLLFPAMWVAPFDTIHKIYQQGIKDTAFTSSGEPTLLPIKYFYYLEVFVYRCMPITVLAFAIGMIRLFKSKPRSKQFFSAVFILLLNQIFIYAIPTKIKDRYVITILPYYLLLAAYGYHFLLSTKNKIIKTGAIIAMLISYCLVAYVYHPVYSFYYSEIIGGAAGIEKTGLLIKNRGEYYAQAALYLNNLDGKKSFTKNVLIDHREQVRTFAPFYYGKIYTSPGLLPDGQHIDYVLIRNDYEHIVPTDHCLFIKAFGPRSLSEDNNQSLAYNVIRVYKCEGVEKTYKGFRN